MTKTITRADICSTINRKLGFSQSEAADILDGILNEISASLKEDDTVKLSGFGNFVLRKKKQRIGRNPKTGQEAIISARNSVTFSASQMLKKKING